MPLLYIYRQICQRFIKKKKKKSKKEIPAFLEENRRLGLTNPKFRAGPNPAIETGYQ
jgi:hypothetical protein